MAAERSSVFEATYRRYLADLADRDLDAAAGRLGLEMVDGAVVVPFLGSPFRVSVDGVMSPAGGRPPFPVRVVILKFLLIAPDSAPGGLEWAAYRDFPDAAPLLGYFAGNAEAVVAREFTGRLDALAAAADRLGGRPPETSYPYDLARIVDFLPGLPALLLFNDADETFGAGVSILFQRRISRYLDMESVAIAGVLLAETLTQD